MNWPHSIPGLNFDGADSAAFRDAESESRAALEGTIACPLLHLGTIACTGPETVDFLQGQLSNDVRRVTPERAQLSSYNSAKGRMLAILHLYGDGTRHLLELPRAVLEPVLKRLRMFVLRSKTQLEDASGDHHAIGISGPDAPALLQSAGLKAPRDVLARTENDGIGVIRRHDAEGRLRYSVHGGADRLAGLWSQWSTSAQPVGTSAWRLLDITAGIPAVYPPTSDRFVAQMCNLDALGGVSFDKGCYTGQEVIARVHYRGAVKRKMSTVRLELPPPVPGTRLDAGEVVDAAPHPDGGSLALVVAPDRDGG